MPIFWEVSDYSNLKLKNKEYKKKISPKSYKTEIKIFADSGLALSGFEQPGPAYKWLPANCWAT